MMAFIRTPFVILTAIFLMGTSTNAGLFTNILNYAAPVRRIAIKNFQTEKCDNNQHHLLDLKDINVFTKENEDIRISGLVKNAIFLHSPVTVRVTLKKKTTFVWLKVPCVNDFGSCTYEDLCEYGYSHHEACPPSFSKNHVPCRCPIEKGIYSIPEDVHIPMPQSRWGGIAKGNYRAKVHFLHDQNEIACYIATFTLTSS